jgi:hypothetical protein
VGSPLDADSVSPHASDEMHGRPHRNPCLPVPHHPSRFPVPCHPSRHRNSATGIRRLGSAVGGRGPTAQPTCAPTRARLRRWLQT